jgi:uncharacterized protein (TIGR00369 family)
MNKEIIQEFKKHVGKHAGELASGLSAWLNGRLESVDDDGQVVVSFVVRDDMLNPLGFLHGGSLAAIHDEVMGLQLFLHNNTGAPFVAISLHVDFHRTTKPGETIRVVPSITKLGKTTAHAECKIYNEAGKLVSQGSNHFARLT